MVERTSRALDYQDNQRENVDLLQPISDPSSEDLALIEAEPIGEITHLDPKDPFQSYLQAIGFHKLLTREEEAELAYLFEQGRIAEQEIFEDNCQDMDRYRHNQDVVETGRRAREKLIRHNLRLVVSIAKNFVGMGLDIDDLVQEGNLGLIKAVEKFDYRKGNKFSTYGNWWIRQAITRGIAAKSQTIHKPEKRSRLLRSVIKYRNQLEVELGREIGESELAEKLNLDFALVSEALEPARPILSLDEPVGQDGDTSRGDFIPDRNEPDAAENMAERSDLSHLVQEVFKTLPVRERQVMEMRYGFVQVEENTYNYIGQLLGLSGERVRQIEAGVLKKLRDPQLINKLRDYIEY